MTIQRPQAIVYYLELTKNTNPQECEKLVARIEKKTGAILDDSLLRICRTDGFYGGFWEVVGIVTGEHGKFHVEIKEVAGQGKVKTHNKVMVSEIKCGISRI